MKTQGMTADWAGETATSLLARATQATERESTERAGVVSLGELVGREGAVWMQRLAAALDTAVRTFNARLGRELLQLRHTEVSLSVTAHPQYLGVVFDPGAESDHAGAGLRLFTQTTRGRTEQPIDFAVGERGRLVVLIAGGDHGPESACRALLEPWLQQLNLGGR